MHTYDDRPTTTVPRLRPPGARAEPAPEGHLRRVRASALGLGGGRDGDPWGDDQ